ncbi:MAG: LamG domain-containing protein [Acidobacteria bacterium]|nr:LamG domain-containing protein [Acidobacteriota bacterium]
MRVRRSVSAAVIGLLVSGVPQDYQGISATLPTGSASIAARGLVAAYDMETTTVDGRLRDFSGNGHHGAMSTSDLIDGVVGRARRYDSVEDKVALVAAGGFDLNGPHTIAAWVRVDTLGLHQHVFACDDKWALWITPDDQWRLGDTRGGGWSTKENTVLQGRWTSVVSELRGTKGDPLTPDTVSLYVDGLLASASEHLRTDTARDVGTWNPGDLHPTDACYIGYESHQGVESHKTLPFVGVIDEVLLFSRAWTEDEVRAFAARKVSR